MHASRNAQRLGNGFDRARNSGPSASLSWFASNMLMRQRVSRSTGRYSGDIWLTANTRRSFSPHSSFSAPATTRKATREESRPFSPDEWMIFVGFALGLTSCPPLSVEHAWAYCGMLRLCEGCRSFLSNSSALLCLSVRMVFPSAAKSSGVPAHPLQCCASLLAEEQQRLPSQEVEPSRSPFRLSPLQKHRRPFPLSTTIQASAGQR